MYGFTIVENLQKIDQDIKRHELKYHQKRVLVSKEFTFDAAHHLHCYEGKCKNLHGHTYKVIFGVSGLVDDIGLVIDFGDIKKIWKEQIEVHLDHRYLNDTLPNMNTTAENMVVWIYEKMEDALKDDPNQCRVEFVKLYETPTSFAEARREWMRDE
ncbi:6-carboxytetrahydropterin synthase QueD [Halobacillus litoralis]|uniref:6-carboxy-5,6,7,8-tetrahydropterin synthase n=1 Tax=Halobacillus litoralis TaxID=45668 RepID=A0A845FGV5_9BACI|nr:MULTISPECIES: 6-carboxytetrahydropterin synthase QueD [Halobacillus]MBN9655666.1 6-carboxytetrahydropterin synthase QueD [Halobacillus sp. GSS1]MEC3885822.1 6-carboxytetrahydropterin synthase QueD [Halobacillus sp. HZG1]MYL72745.1 6-carboxytetrahydropterin synthase QueD [Halobacillus litoralis]